MKTPVSDFRVMKIHIKSNFVIPGLKDEESVDLDRSEMTLRDFLEELSAMSPNRLEYVKPGAKVLDPDDWEVDINDIPYQNCRDGLETPLKNGDTVTIRIMALGGG
jgi:molybdopterin converting factor small subunit